ncbi:MAG: hypothetical protein ACTSWA_05265 [Candidatus Thorarchaeota archaeon]
MDEKDVERVERVIPSQKLEEINVGDKLIILTRAGRENRPIGRLSDGRVVLISKESTMQVDIGDTVIGEVVHVTKTYVIIMPERVLGDTDEALILNLKNVITSGHYQHAVLAKALLRIFSMLK